MSKSMEEALVNTFECFIARGPERGNFLRKYRGAFAMFVGEKATKHLTEAAIKDEQPNADIFESAALECGLARVAFAKHARGLTYKQYIDEIDKAMKDLVFHDFAEDEVKAFKHIMRGHVARLEGAGWMNQPCRPAKLVFLDSDIEVATSSLQDQWTLRLAAGVKSTAVNSGSLRLLPWEALLWAPGELHTVNSSSRVPENLLDNYAKARDAVAKKMCGKELTITEMQRAMANDAKALCI